MTKRKAFAGKVFRPPKGKTWDDLKCYVVDSDGNRIPMHVTSEVIMLLPNKVKISKNGEQNESE